MDWELPSSPTACVCCASSSKRGLGGVYIKRRRECRRDSICYLFLVLPSHCAQVCLGFPTLALRAAKACARIPKKATTRNLLCAVLGRGQEHHKPEMNHTNPSDKAILLDALAPLLSSFASRVRAYMPYTHTHTHTYIYIYYT